MSLIRSCKIGLALSVLVCVLLSGCVSRGEEGGQAGGQTGAPGLQNNQNGGGTNGSVQEPGEAGGEGQNTGRNAGGAGAHTGEGAVPSPSETVLRRLASMTLDEKLGQMVIGGMEGKRPGAATKRMIEQQHVGGVIFYKDNVTVPKGVVSYVNQLKAWSRGNPAPLFVSVDEEGGIVSRLPGLVGFPDAWDVGRADDPAYAGKIGGFLGKACRAMGMNVDYAPVLDINSNPNNPVIGVRSYGDSPDIVSRNGVEVMRGIRAAGVIPVVKHFPGHGDTSVDSHLELPVVRKSLKQLQAFEWVPFADAIHAGADAVMVAHILFPQIDSRYPASLSKAIITGELRGLLGFTGVVITDDLTMGAIEKHFGIGEAAVRSVTAGGDIMLVAHGYDNVTAVIAALKHSVATGGIPEKRIDESVTRILMLKEKYGLTDLTKVNTPNLSSLNEEIRKAEAAHRNNR